MSKSVKLVDYAKVCIFNSGMAAAVKRGKGKTIPIKLVSTAGTGFFYTTRKNISKTPEKLSFVKFDPVVRQRVIFKEGKIK